MIAGSPYPFTLVCPLCRGALEFTPLRIACRRCAGEFAYQEGIPDLVVGGRFEDADDPDRMAYEDVSNADTTRNYLVPTFRGLLRELAHRPRLLSVGCGVGIDVDILTQAGFDVVGIDCGNRCQAWARREQRHRLYLANGKHLPFEDATFDLVYCGCVFPHVGVVGDSRKVRPDYAEERLAIAREMTRVVRPGGHILVSSPNRLFPLDIFHGRSAEQPYPLLNLPTNPFLLSAGDYQRLFREAGCDRARCLPVNGYWGFVRMKKRRTGRVLAVPVEAVFRLVSWRALRFLARSPINPWLVVLMEKAAPEPRRRRDDVDARRGSSA